MKKILSIAMALVLALSLSCVVFADSDLTASYTNHVNDGLDVATIDLPAEFVEGDTVTLKIKGTADANFRVYLGNGVYPTRESDIVTVEVVDGAFEVEVVLVASLAEGTSKGVANNVVVKGASYGLPVPEITWEYITLVGDAAADAPAEEEAPATEEEAPVEDTTTEEAPATEETEPADTGLALAVVPMLVAAVAVVASKRR